MGRACEQGKQQAQMEYNVENAQRDYYNQQYRSRSWKWCV